MYRTTLVLPSPLKERATILAESQSISFGQLVRLALERYVATASDPLSQDTFFSSRAVFEEVGDCDAAALHDRYLYGESETKGPLQNKSSDYGFRDARVARRTDEAVLTVLPGGVTQPDGMYRKPEQMSYSAAGPKAQPRKKREKRSLR